MEENYFSKLYAINVSDKIDKKGGLSYLSWAWAWAELKKVLPDSTFKVYENQHGWIYHTDGRTGWVKTGVTVSGIEHIEYLPIMDNRNKAISIESITSCDVNKSIQRSLTKAIGRHGLGLSIYAGEDLPDGEENKAVTAKNAETEKQAVILEGYITSGIVSGDNAKKAQLAIDRGALERINEWIEWAKKHEAGK